MSAALLYLATQRPELLVRHAEGYFALSREVWLAQTQLLKRRAMWMAIAVVSFGVAAVHIGIVTLLCLTEGAFSGPPWWALVAVPALPLLLGVVSLWQALRLQVANPLAHWNAQVEADLSLLRSARTSSASPA